jgi:arylsulfatase
VPVARAAALGLLALAACRPPGPPNLLLVTLDTLRADHLGSYGFALETSPEIDRLARSGVLFERAVAASSTTAPSHASILTSRYTREHSVGYLTGRTRLAEAPTLAEQLRGAGYATAGFVSNPNLRRRLGFDRGFDHFDDELPKAEPNRPAQFERVAEETTARAIAWLAAPRREPWFLWVHYQDPHGPYAPPPGHADRFRVPPAPGEAELEVLESNDGIGGIPAYQALPGLRLPSQYLGRYADEIFYADASLGRLLAAADDFAAGRETAVLLTADHGESLGEGGAWFVHFLVSTPQLSHVPMILTAPGVAPGRRSEPVSHVDVLPTLLELAGLSAPAGARGVALGPYLREGRPLPDRVVYCDSGAELSAYRAGSFVRVVGLRDAWRQDAPPRLEPEWGGYEWREDGSFEQIEEGARERELVMRDHREVEAYFRSVVPMIEATPPDAEDAERLRALGYLTAEEEAGASPAPGRGAAPAR